MPRQSALRATGVALLLLLGGAMAGASIRVMSLRDLTLESEQIIRATVVSMDAFREAPDRGSIYTHVRLRPAEVLKGTGTREGGEITVRVLGGTVKGVRAVCHESPRFAPGEDVLVFLTRESNGAVIVNGWFQGKYTIVDGKIRELRNETWAGLSSKIAALLATGGRPR